MNRGGRDAYKDAAARAVDAQVERAEKCPGCGMTKGSRLGDHYLGCEMARPKFHTPVCGASDWTCVCSAEERP